MNAQAKPEPVRQDAPTVSIREGASDIELAQRLVKLVEGQEQVRETIRQREAHLAELREREAAIDDEIHEVKSRLAPSGRRRSRAKHPTRAATSTDGSPRLPARTMLEKSIKLAPKKWMTVVEVHALIKTGGYSRAATYKALETLERAGVVERKSSEKTGRNGKPLNVYRRK